MRLTEELSLKFYLTLFNFNLNSYVWLVATVLESTALDLVSFLVLEYK